MIEKAYKVKPIIYTNVDFYESFLAGQFDEYPLWVAHYLVKDKPPHKTQLAFLAAQRNRACKRHRCVC